MDIEGGQNKYEAKIKASILVYNPLSGYGRALENMVGSAYSSVRRLEKEKELLELLKDPNNEMDFLLLENNSSDMPELGLLRKIRAMDQRKLMPVILIVPSRGQNFELAMSYGHKDRKTFIIKKPYDLSKIKEAIHSAGAKETAL